MSPRSCLVLGHLHWFTFTRQLSQTMNHIKGKAEPHCLLYVRQLSHYNKARHWVDDHNNCKHMVSCLSDQWKTKWWSNRQFTFIWDVAKVRTNHIMTRGCKQPAERQLQFWRNFANIMILNKITSKGMRVMEMERPVTRPHLCTKECQLYLNQPPYLLGWLGLELKCSKARYMPSRSVLPLISCVVPIAHVTPQYYL
jgi:hypothetical protein